MDLRPSPMPFHQHHHQHRTRKRANDPINIDITSESTLSVSSCLAIVVDLLKYILYQRCQIPVPYDALVREARKQRQAHRLEEDVAEEDEPNLQYDVMSRKKEIMRRKLRRRRHLWLLKAERLVQSFNDIRESLHTELQGGEVQGVSIILGSSVMAGREVYTITLPHDTTQDTSFPPPHHQHQHHHQHHTGLKLFRNLVTNEELLRVMNQPCGIQRVWVMVQKPDTSQLLCPGSPTIPVTPGITTNTNNHFKKTDTTTTTTDTTTTMLIPRPEYSHSHRATKVEISLQHSSLYPPMDLTPTVESRSCFVTQSTQRVGTKRSLNLYTPAVPRLITVSQDALSLHPTSLDCKDAEVNMATSLCDFGRSFPISLFRNSDSCRNVVQETPVKMFKGDATLPMVETPIIHSSALEMDTVSTSPSPSKQLAAQLGTCHLSDTLPDSLWYQIDSMIHGFRDICMKP